MQTIKHLNHVVVVSDIHLGNTLCRCNEFLQFILNLDETVEALVINGDLFDSMDARLKKTHWHILSALRKISDKIEVIWVKGNHDSPDPETIAHVLGLQIYPSIIIQHHGIRILCVHGDQWDSFLTKHPILTNIADFFYVNISRLNHKFGPFLKRSSKVFLRNTEKVKKGAIKLKRKVDCDVVICGHTHFAVYDLESGYFNTGCWTQTPQSFMIIKDGRICLSYLPQA